MLIVARLPEPVPSKQLKPVEGQNDCSDPNWCEPGPVQMLIGAGVWSRIIQDGIMSNGLVRQNTKLGQILFGEHGPEDEYSAICGVSVGEGSLAKVISQLWESEVISEAKPMSPEDVWCENNFHKTPTRSSTGRYIVMMPLNPKDDKLGESRKAALRRFYMVDFLIGTKPGIC